MRLGDVDKLLYHKRKVMFFGLGQDDECWGFAVPVEEIDKAPTIDAVPVVRCQECKHKNTTACPAYDAPFMRTSLRIKFCSEGKRKEGDHVRNN